MKEPIDQLSWSEFFKNSKNRKKIPKKVERYNRLIAYSKNFFVISGYGAFTPGYMLIISKEFIPAYGLIKREEKDELNFIITQLKDLIRNEFNRKSVVFEHGMCACIGGLDRAHLHVMSLSIDSNEKSITQAINDTLYERKAGIKHIMYNNYKLENIHDINQIYENFKKENSRENIKIFGKIYKLKDVQNLNQNEWPFTTLKHIQKGGHYVYFRSDYLNSSFLTTNNFQTQFGRQVVYNNEIKLDKKFRIRMDKKNINEIWRWQNSMFEENILETMRIAKVGLEKLKKKFIEQHKKFEIKIC